jgi:hypothetical protein
VGTNKEAKEALKRYENAKILVAVCGYPKRSANCSHMEVYSVLPAAEFAPKLAALGGRDSGG